MNRIIPVISQLGFLGFMAACAPVEEVDGAVSSGPCYAADIAPALIETETVQALETPEVRDENGNVTAPAVYRSEITQRIVRERQEVKFETLCEVNTSPEFVATLQRSLKARGHLNGAITGVMDEPTKRAIRSYQSTRGLNSDILSLAAAKELGLIAYDRHGL